MLEAMVNVLLQPLSHQHHDVDSALHEQVQSVLVVVVRPDGGPTQQLFTGVFGGQWEVSVLLQVCSGDDRHQVPLLVHDRKFT